MPPCCSCFTQLRFLQNIMFCSPLGTPLLLFPFSVHSYSFSLLKLFPITCMPKNYCLEHQNYYYLNQVSHYFPNILFHFCSDMTLLLLTIRVNCNILFQSKMTNFRANLPLMLDMKLSSMSSFPNVLETTAPRSDWQWIIASHFYSSETCTPN